MPGTLFSYLLLIRLYDWRSNIGYSHLLAVDSKDGKGKLGVGERRALSFKYVFVSPFGEKSISKTLIAQADNSLVQYKAHKILTESPQNFVLSLIMISQSGCETQQKAGRSMITQQETTVDFNRPCALNFYDSNPSVSEMFLHIHVNYFLECYGIES